MWLEKKLVRANDMNTPPAVARSASARSGAGSIASTGAPLSPEREAELLRSLEGIFLAEGGLRLTLADLAGRLRCSKRTLYLIAPSKEELFLRVLRGNLDRISQLGLEAEQRATSVQDGIADYVLAALIEVRKWSATFLADIDSFGSARQMLDEHLDERMRYLEHMIDAGIASGVFNATNSVLVAEILHASAMRFCSPAFIERAGMSLGQAVEQMCALISYGLVRGQSRRDSGG
jgi:AcrR family transcriptional regulator